MQRSDLSTWHAFTYTQLYPAVLGSMLYDVLHMSKVNPLRVLEWCVTLFYVLDYLHLHSDLRSDHPEHANKWDTLLDASVAIVLGISYWSFSDGSVRWGYGLWLSASLLFLIYYAVADWRRTSLNVCCIGVTSMMLFVGWVLCYWFPRERWKSTLPAILAAAIYCTFIFLVKPRYKSRTVGR